MYEATGTSYAFEYRMHSPRIGRFLSIDPLAFLFVWNSPYAFSENRVLDMVELEGLEAASTDDKKQSDGVGKLGESGMSADDIMGMKTGSSDRRGGWMDEEDAAIPNEVKPTTPSESQTANPQNPDRKPGRKKTDISDNTDAPPTGKQYFAGDKLGNNGFKDGMGMLSRNINTLTELPSIPISGMSQNLANIVKARSQYGRLSSTVTVRTNFGFNVTLKSKPLLKVLNVAKKFGVVGFAIGAASSVDKWRTGEIGTTRMAADVIFGAAGLLPGAGWLVSGSYSIIMDRYDNYLKEGCILCW